MYGEVFASNSETKTEKRLNTWLTIPKYLDLTGGQDVRIYRSVYMRTNGTGVQLVNRKTDDIESVITIHASIAAYLSSFRIIRVRVITARMFIVEYWWQTGELTSSIHYFRIINIAVDGTLSQTGEYTIANADTTSVENHGVLCKSLINGTIPMKLVRNIYRATGLLALAFTNTYTAWKTPTISFQTTAVNLSNQQTNVYAPPFDRCISKGGAFYRYGSPAIDYIYTTMGYYGGGDTYIKLSVAGADIAALGVTDHYVLGFSEGGLFITVQIQNDTALVYIWDMNTKDGTLKMLGDTSFTLGTANIISFEHNVFILDDGRRFLLTTSLTGFITEELPQLTLMQNDPFDYYGTDFSEGTQLLFTPNSDVWNGLLVY